MTHVLAIYSQHCDVLAAVIYFALRILAVPSAARTLTTLAVIWVYTSSSRAPYSSRMLAYLKSTKTP
jgi:hypothetical protein